MFHQHSIKCNASGYVIMKYYTSVLLVYLKSVPKNVFNIEGETIRLAHFFVVDMTYDLLNTAIDNALDLNMHCRFLL